MGSEIIYERKYAPIPVLEDWEKALEEANAMELTSPLPTFEELCQKLQERVTYIPRPDRIEASEAFIRDAIDVSDQHRLDIRITRHPHSITVAYTFPSAFNLRSLLDLLTQADDLSLEMDTDRTNILLTIEYETHETVWEERAGV